jgi:hypothetical protein
VRKKGRENGVEKMSPYKEKQFFSTTHQGHAIDVRNEFIFCVILPRSQG